MADRYLPSSPFLQAVADGEIILSGQHGEDNLKLLIKYTEDKDAINRDWATLLLSQQEDDSPEVRDALVRAAQDPDDNVRAEAILGIAQRDPKLALPLVKKALSGAAASVPIFEAAAIVADASLLRDLLDFANPPSGEKYLDMTINDAIQACRRAEQAGLFKDS
jgi:HEAT repeat protein